MKRLTFLVVAGVLAVLYVPLALRWWARRVVDPTLREAEEPLIGYVESRRSCKVHLVDFEDGLPFPRCRARISWRRLSVARGGAYDVTCLRCLAVLTAEVKARNL